MSMILFQEGHFRDSLEEAFAAYELVDNDNGFLANQVAQNLRILGDPRRAAMWYRAINANRPGANDYMIADCFSDLTDDENAAAVYRRVWTLLPEQPEGWMGICRLALLQKDFGTARKISSENWQRYRDFVFSEEMAAQVEFFSRNFPEGEKLYQELAAKDPNGGGEFYGAVSYRRHWGGCGSQLTARRVADRFSKMLSPRKWKVFIQCQIILRFCIAWQPSSLH